MEKIIDYAVNKWFNNLSEGYKVIIYAILLILTTFVSLYFLPDKIYNSTNQTGDQAAGTINNDNKIISVNQTADTINNQINCSILQVEVPVGEIDSNNNKFIVSHMPEYIYSDGIILFESAGYLYSKGGIQMTNPPVLILKSFYRDNICK